MKSAGEPPVGGENVLCPELVKKEDARSSAVVYYDMCGILGITSLFHSQNLVLYHNEQSAESLIFPNHILSERNS